jgi:probable F420-dependent oxidoreductase
MKVGGIGVWTSFAGIGDGNGAEAAKLAETLGFSVFWLGGSSKLPALAPLLEATERIVVATGILNVWQNEPATVAAQHAELSGRFPGRVLLGIGIGHPEAIGHYASPLATMESFFDGLDSAETPVPRDERCAAALGPKMLDLCGARSLGTHSYFTPVAHTRFARERLGENALVAPELSCVVDTDTERARATARGFAALYLSLGNYTRNLLKFGFTDEDIANGGSDRLIDAIIPNGTAQEVAEAAGQHFRAGANHVCLQPVGIKGIPRESWTALASALDL